ncbi:MAG TPA: VOC family protein [Pseudolabrys sp.]
MKRFHVYVGVDDLAASIRFYSTLFAAASSVTKPDYAKWMLDNPRVNFAISQGRGAAGVHHLGIQAEDEDELTGIYGRLAAADAPVLEGATVCCYAKSTKSWISDPQGVAWETFFTHGDSTVYGGNGPAIGRNPGDASPARNTSCGRGPAIAAE